MHTGAWRTTDRTSNSYSINFHHWSLDLSDDLLQESSRAHDEAYTTGFTMKENQEEKTTCLRSTDKKLSDDPSVRQGSCDKPSTKQRLGGLCSQAPLFTGKHFCIFWTSHNTVTLNVLHVAWTKRVRIPSEEGKRTIPTTTCYHAHPPLFSLLPDSQLVMKI